MIRIGVDVGGTFTKAVAVDPESGRLLGRAVVPTTHHTEHGVADGVVAALRAVLASGDVDRQAVQLVMLSTTQAVNALVEGDIVPVGVLALGPRQERRQTIERTRLQQITLAPGRTLAVHHVYLDSEDVTPERLRAALEHLAKRGARALAISAAYAVEDPAVELLALDVAQQLGIPATAGHQLTGLYGLEVRTVTAAMNASILPRMRETTAWVNEALSDAGIDAPLLVLNGDLSVAPLDQLSALPAASILSGPAASVAGALRQYEIVNALFVEVGGTSTNIGVIRDGRPALRYVRIMRHPTCLRSVDVHVAGIGGGSLVRLDRGRIVGVGPRSAHIAGLPYASFVAALHPPLRLERIAPTPGDEPCYAAVRDATGQLVAITLTDAANALGLLPAGDYARGNAAFAQMALEPLAAERGDTVEHVARQILHHALALLTPLAQELLREYSLRRARVVGLGGGAGVLVPLLAEQLRLPAIIAEHAEVMASLGAATTPLNLLTEVQVRTGPDILRAVEQAESRLTRLGAAPDSVHVVVEPIPEREAVRIRATAVDHGQRSMIGNRIGLETAQRLAAEALDVDPAVLSLQFANAHYFVFTTTVQRGLGPFRRVRHPIAVIDRFGTVCFRAADGWCRALRHGEPVPECRTGQDGCACAIVGARCLQFDRWSLDLRPLAATEPICLLVGQPARG